MTDAATHIRNIPLHAELTSETVPSVVGYLKVHRLYRKRQSCFCMIIGSSFPFKMC